MITVGMNYEVIKGKESVFEEKFARVLEVMAGADGHGVTRLYQDVFKGGSYLIVSEWHARDAFETFIHSEIFHKVTQWGKDHILTARPEHKVYGGDENLSASGAACPAN